MLRTLLFVSLFLTLALLARADGEQEKKKPEAEPAPAPKFVPPKPKPIIVVPDFHYPRTDTREVWQHYGPNSFGRMVPRVILTPEGENYSRILHP